MIAFLEGVIADKQPTSVILDVNGIGYEVQIPLSTYDRLPPKHQRCRLLTYDHLREDAHQIFGFMTEGERHMFVQLLGISGIGPKLALRALSGLTVRELKAAIVTGDVKRLSSISGIGRKTAERIVVDLRDKIGRDEALEAAAEHPVEQDVRVRDAMLALVALGYKHEEAKKTVGEVIAAAAERKLTVEEIVKLALRQQT